MASADAAEPVRSGSNCSVRTGLICVMISAVFVTCVYSNPDSGGCRIANEVYTDRIKVTQCVSANTTPHRLRWGDRGFSKYHASSAALG